MEWEYLTAPALQTRYVVAEFFARRCRHIIEVGGYRTPISLYLSKPYESVTVIGPGVIPLPDGLNGSGIVHLPILVEDYHDDLPRGFALVALGIDHIGPDGCEKLLELTKQSQLAVLETAESFIPSMEVLNFLVIRSGKVVTVKMRMDVSGSQLPYGSDSYPPRSKRILYVLEEAQ